MSYVNEIVLNGATVQLNSLEGLQDANGNNRFVGGNITSGVITNVDFSYCKWSLSGTHLMLVICAYNNTEQSIASDTIFGSVALPNYILNKIVGLVGATHIVSKSTAITFNDSNYQSGSFNIYLVKDSTGVTVKKWGAETIAKCNIRIQFDLIIDND